MTLKFRPHHFFCTLGFQGKGYSDEFVDNFATLKGSLTLGTIIEVTSKTDDICAPCPHRRGDLCETQGKIEVLDLAHAKALGLKEGDQLTWGEALESLKALSLQDHLEICQGCQWLDLGICAKSLKSLKDSRSTKIPDVVTALLNYKG